MLNGFFGMGFELRLDLVAVDVARGCQQLGHGAQALGIGGVSTATPNVAQQGFTHIAVGQALRIARYSQTQQGQRVERVRCGKLQV